LARRRREYSAQERRELWERWKRGESVSEIGRALERAPGTISCTIRLRGGVAHSERRRTRLALTLREREEISRGVAAGESARGIAARLGRAPSTITRELNRHQGRHRYRAAEADRRAWERARRPQGCKLARLPALSRIVAAKLREDWSPAQIAGWLKIEFPDDETMRVSHETIYLTLFIQARGALKQELVAHLRRTLAPSAPDGEPRQPRPGTNRRCALDPETAGRGSRPGDPRPLGRRPARRRRQQPRRDTRRAALSLPDAGRRRRKGHPLSHQRAQPPGRPATAAAPQLAHLGPRNGAVRARTLHRRDRRQGLLLRSAKSLAARLERNTNGLLRQYLPKGTDLSKLSHTQLDAIAAKLNTRPRQTLDFKTPAATLNEALR
jgi:IS30 family transposase